MYNMHSFQYLFWSTIMCAPLDKLIITINVNEKEKGAKQYGNGINNYKYGNGINYYEGYRMWTDWGPWSYCYTYYGREYKDRTRSCRPTLYGPCPNRWQHLKLYKKTLTCNNTFRVPTNKAAETDEDSGHGKHEIDWSYIGESGPVSWGNTFEKCNGNNQSPINLDSAKADKKKLPKINFTVYSNITSNKAELENNGHTVKLSLLESSTSTMSGGPLNGTYEFKHLHFHSGSEHTVKGKRFPLEMHMVHSLNGLGDNDALKVSNGFAVAGFLFEISQEDNPSLGPIVSHFSTIKNPGTKTIVKETLSIADVISPAAASGFFSYSGSLTTPPCNEAVQWIIFKHTLKISHSQLYFFSRLQAQGGYMSDNFRPVQPLNGRTVLQTD